MPKRKATLAEKKISNPRDTDGVVMIEAEEIEEDILDEEIPGEVKELPPLKPRFLPVKASTAQGSYLPLNTSQMKPEPAITQPKLAP